MLYTIRSEGQLIEHLRYNLLYRWFVGSAPLVSQEHFTVDGTLNDTHASTTDPEAKLYTKSSGQAAKLSYMGHVLMENRHGLAVGAAVAQAAWAAETEAALKRWMAAPLVMRATRPASASASWWRRSLAGSKPSAFAKYLTSAFMRFSGTC